MSSDKSDIICTAGTKLIDCERNILQAAINEADLRQKKRQVESPEIKTILKIVETFIRDNKLLLYGGIALNNLLPEEDRFYSQDFDLPDYDSYSPSALVHIKELADIFVKRGYVEVEAKTAIHLGTFKLFVNFFPVADITQLSTELYETLQADAVVRDGLQYAPINFLRGACYSEMSRPNGDITRWTKVFFRLSMLNKHYPLSAAHNCKKIDFQRASIPSVSVNVQVSAKSMPSPAEIFDVLKTTFISEGVVFFGGFAMMMYSQYMPASQRKRVKKLADFDVLSDNPEAVVDRIKRNLDNLVKGKTSIVSVVRHDSVDEIIAEHYEICVGANTVAFIYRPLACHSYNTTDKGIKVASIDTILSFYMYFLYANRPYYDVDRLLCMSNYLFDVQQRNRLNQVGLLRRFSINCTGYQETLVDMRSHKMEMYKKLKKGTVDYDYWFLRYRPGDNARTRARKKPKSSAKPAKTRKNRKLVG